MIFGIQFVHMMWLIWLMFEEIPLLLFFFFFFFVTEHVNEILHGPSMLPDKAKFVVCSIISLALSF